MGSSRAFSDDGLSGFDLLRNGGHLALLVRIETFIVTIAAPATAFAAIPVGAGKAGINRNLVYFLRKMLLQIIAKAVDQDTIQSTPALAGHGNSRYRTAAAMVSRQPD